MIQAKTRAEIELLAEGGKILSHFLDDLSALVAPGVTGNDINKAAAELAKRYDVVPSFLGYRGRKGSAFPAAICVSVNEAVVHGLPDDTPFAEGNLVGLDMGIIYKKMYLDSARTVPVRPISDETQILLDVTRHSLQLGIEAARLGNTTGHIGAAIESYVEGEKHLAGNAKLKLVRQLVGHGVGYAVHEEPQVPNFGRAGAGAKLVEGLVIAIEPMVTIGNAAVETADDGWTVITSSGNLSAHEEHTVAITAEGPRVLTQAC